jgi:DNA-binding winged helix-turn-helix (wHTH) protein/tetratricopeptide (TPR) repeat protein
MPSQDRIHIGVLDIDLATYRLYRGGENVRLTPTEWSLLRELIHHPNQVLSHRTLLKRVWGEEYETELDYVHTYVSRLRRKLEDNPSNPGYILTEAGIGYRFNGEAIEKKPESDPTPAVPPKAPSERYINPLPQHMGGRYIGREDQREQLKSLLLDDVRLVSIYGRAGVGKTALVCTVLEDLQADNHFDGMVFLSMTSTGITLGRILSDFNRLLGDHPIPDHQQAIYRVTNLLDRLRRGIYLLLLDNLEHLQDPLTNDLTDDDLAAFFRVLLEQGGTLRVVVTSRYPLNLPRTVKAWERVVALEDGLTLEDGVALLRRGDPDGTAGLRDADEGILAEIVRRTHGLPRALEAAVGMLLEAPLMSPADLLSDASLLSTEIGDMFIKGAIETLSDDAVRVMEWVSMFERIVPLVMLEQLAAPQLQASQLRLVLNRLVRAFFLTYNPDNKTVSMHPIDRAYCYERVEPQRRKELHLRIASLYDAITMEEPPSNTTQLAAPLAAFNHRLHAGQVEDAAKLLLDLDYEYLSIWGNYAELSESYGRLVDHVADHALHRRVLLRQGEALRRIGKLHEAILRFERVVALAVAADDEQTHAEALGSLGWAYYDTGQFPAAQEQWQSALAIFRENGDLLGEGELLGGMGWVAYLMGDYDEALTNVQQSLHVLGQSGKNRLYRLGVNIGDAGVIRAAQGDTTLALHNLRESLAIAQASNSISEQSYKGGYLATALLQSGEIEEAADTAQTAVQHDVPANRHFVAAVYGIALARLGRTDDAIAAFEDTLRYADSVLRLTSGLYQARYAHALALAGLTLLRGDDIAEAVEDYRAALAMCSTRGVRENNLRLLESLDPHSKLVVIRNLLED